MKTEINLFEIFNQIQQSETEIVKTANNCAEGYLYEGLQFIVQAITKQKLTFGQLDDLAKIFRDEIEYQKYIDEIEFKYEESVSHNFKGIY